MSKANNNCRNDKIVWHRDNCTGTVIAAPGDQDGMCVPLKSISSFTGVIGSRYSGCSAAGSQIQYLYNYGQDIIPFFNDLIGDVSGPFNNAMNSDNAAANLINIMQVASSVFSNR
jgi:hypothetical protein